MEPAIVIYLAMGLVAAKILLDGSTPKPDGSKAFFWLELTLKTAWITLLWPLVLFTEKVEHWLKDDRPPKTSEPESHKPADS
jgi:hypothetical protein